MKGEKDEGRKCKEQGDGYIRDKFMPVKSVTCNRISNLSYTFSGASLGRPGDWSLGIE